jgi:hypothetical protein
VQSLMSVVVAFSLKLNFKHNFAECLQYHESTTVASEEKTNFKTHKPNEIKQKPTVLFSCEDFDVDGI